MLCIRLGIAKTSRLYVILPSELDRSWELRLGAFPFACYIGERSFDACRFEIVMPGGPALKIALP